jgi:arylformamidase
MKPLRTLTCNLAALVAVGTLAACGGGNDTPPAPGPNPAPTACAGTDTERTTVAYKTVAGVAPNLLSLDMYKPVRAAGCAAAPIVIFAHGGGYRQGDKAYAIGDKVRLFNGEGWLFASINYRLSPSPPEPTNPNRVMYPTHQQDAAAAIAWVVRNAAAFGGDASRVALVGHSAGAHLVALLSTDPQFLVAEGLGLSTLQCTVPLDVEIYDLADAMARDPTDAIWLNAFGSDPAVYQQASPARQVSAQRAHPAHWLVTRGSPYALLQTTGYANTLNAAGIRADALNASPYTHEEINSAVGRAGETVVTPPLMSFLRSCFAS